MVVIEKAGGDNGGVVRNNGSRMKVVMEGKAKDGRRIGLVARCCVDVGEMMVKKVKVVKKRKEEEQGKKKEGGKKSRRREGDGK